MTESTAYEPAKDAFWRYERLLRVENSLRMIFSLARHETYSEFEQELLEVHDHKGALLCMWKSTQSLERYRGLIDMLWELQNEPALNNEHTVSQQR